MTPKLLGLLLLTQLVLVAGQIFLKHAMNLSHGGLRRRSSAANLAAGIALLTLWFFLWLGLLQKLPLSYVYPFEGLSPVLLVAAAGLFLHERLGWRAWVGVALIAAGVAIVGMS